jgi:hypothetical protein
MDLGWENGPTRAGFVSGEPQHAAAFAARVIGEEALSIFSAVEDATSQIADGARREADEIARAADEAAAPALTHLEAISGHLEALTAELHRMSEQSAERRTRGG